MEQQQNARGMSRAGIGLFIFFHALYALTSSGNAFRIPDEFEVYFQTEHLVDARVARAIAQCPIAEPGVECST